MRMFSRVLATLILGVAVVLTGLTGPASAATSYEKRVDRAEKLVHHAKKLKGKPYRWGGAGPTSFDCAGFVQYVYKKAGKKVGRTSGDQLKGKTIAKNKKRTGDILVFIKNGRAYHSAIYAGNGEMWESQKSGTTVGRHDIWSSGYVVRRPSLG